MTDNGIVKIYLSKSHISQDCTGHLILTNNVIWSTTKIACYCIMPYQYMWIYIEPSARIYATVNWVIIGSRYWLFTSLVSSHYLNQCRFIVIFQPMNRFFFQEYALIMWSAKYFPSCSGLIVIKGYIVCISTSFNIARSGSSVSDTSYTWYHICWSMDNVRWITMQRALLQKSSDRRKHKFIQDVPWNL